MYILSSFIKLTREEAMAIRWHMGGFDESVGGEKLALSNAFNMFPLAVKLHIADMQASKKSSKIGIKIVAYDANHKSTGFAEANLDVSEVKKLWSVVQRNFYGEVISKTRVHNFNLDSTFDGIIAYKKILQRI